MKNIFFILFLLFIGQKCVSQPSDSSISLKLNSLDSTVKQTKAETASLLKKSDSANAAENIKGSFSKTLDYQKKHPDELYKHSFEHWYIYLPSFIFLALFLFKSFSYLFNSALCRDESYFTDENGVTKLKDYQFRPYSYARVQLFWWTVIILSCYTVFFAIYGQLLALNQTVILLMGSGLTIFIFGKTMDNNQIEKNNDNQGAPCRHQDMHDSKGFLSDILSDEGGISIHRLQAVAFNIIYGFAFIAFFIAAIGNLQYPLDEFEAWQLALLGVSGAGYLGLKATENPDATKNIRQTEANTVKRDQTTGAKK